MMRVLRILNMMMVILALTVVGCSKKQETVDIESEREDIARVIDSCIGWFETKDFDLLFSTVAHDSNYISVHPSHRVVRGFEQFRKNSEMFRDPEFRYVKHKITDLKINISQSGDVAWFYCVLDDINTWKGQPASWENTRWTGVLEKRDRRWAIVQQHFSFAAD